MNEVFSVLFLVCVAGQPALPVRPAPYGAVPSRLPNPAYGPVGHAGYGPVGPVNPRAFGPYGPPGAASAASTTIAPSPSIFDLNQAVAGVRSEVHMAQGNSIIGALVDPPFDAINPLERKRGQEILLQSQYAAERHLIRTQNATQENRNKLDDLRLNEAATEEQVARRGAQALPAPFNILAKQHEANSHYDWITLGRNQLDDAKAAYAKDHSYANYVAIRNARDQIQAHKATIAGDKSDIAAAVVGGGLGASLSILGPLKRKESSELWLKTERRNNKKLFAAYLKDPSEDNWWALRLSNVALKAWKQDVQAEQGEIITTPLIGSLGSALGVAIQDVQFSNEENNWKKYNRLVLTNLLRKRARSAYQAQAAQGATAAAPGSVPARMLALNSYGQPPLRTGVPAPPMRYGAAPPRAF